MSDTKLPRAISPGTRRLLAELLGTTDPGGRSVSWLEPATVMTVTAGGATDGASLCQVAWRGVTIPVAYLASYSPVVGHVVLLNVQPPQVVIVGRVVGIPPNPPT